MANIVDVKPSLDELAHYGVKGMHWGQRKAENAARASLPRAQGYSQRAYNSDKRKFGKKAAHRINEAVLNGKSVDDARKVEVNRIKKRVAAIYGGYLAARILYKVGPTILQMGAESYVSKKQEEAGRKAAQDLFSDKRGIGNQKIVDLNFDPVTQTWD